VRDIPLGVDRGYGRRSKRCRDVANDGKFTQKQLITFTANMQTSLIGMEACSGAHFLGRVLREQGHDVKLIPAQFVKPFVKSNKNDFLDAEAIAEAVDRQNMRFARRTQSQ
jgi:transposase